MKDQSQHTAQLRFLNNNGVTSIYQAVNDAAEKKQKSRS